MTTNKPPLFDVNYPRYYGNTPTAWASPVTRTAAEITEAGVKAVFLGIPWRCPPPDAIGGDPRDDHSGLTPAMFRLNSAQFSGYFPELDLDIFEHIKIGDALDTTIYPEMADILADVKARVGQILDAGAWPLTMGGNGGPSSWGVLNAIAERAKRVAVINLDAHPDNLELDWRTDDHMVSRFGLSWANQILDLPNVDPSLYFHYGLRGPRNDPGTKERFIKKGVPADQLFTSRHIKAARKTGYTEWVQSIAKAACTTSDKVWIGVDGDVFDIGVTPDFGIEPMGPTVDEVLELMYEVGRHAGPEKFGGISLMACPADDPAFLTICVWMYMYTLAGVLAYDPELTS